MLLLCTCHSLGFDSISFLYSTAGVNGSEISSCVDTDENFKFEFHTKCFKQKYLIKNI